MLLERAGSYGCVSGGQCPGILRRVLCGKTPSRNKWLPGARDYFAVIWSTDWKEARALEGKFSLAYLGNRNIHAVNDELEAKAEEIIAQYWPAIDALAKILLGREWEPKKRLKSGTQWSESETAKYVTGEEVAHILAGLGITVQSVTLLP